LFARRSCIGASRHLIVDGADVALALARQALLLRLRRHDSRGTARDSRTPARFCGATVIKADVRSRILRRSTTRGWNGFVRDCDARGKKIDADGVLARR